MSAKYLSISHTVIIGTIDTAVPLMPLVTQIYREGGIGTIGMNARNIAKRNRPFCPFDAHLIQHNALDITSSPSLGENSQKNRNLSPSLSPFNFKQARANSFIED